MITRRRALQGALAACLGVAVWATTIGGGAATPAVLPDTTVEFSLDLEVVASTEGPLLYIVEQRARPLYRIFSFDPATGADDTVFTVPEDAIIYGIDLDPSGTTLAIAYTPDHNLGGSGLWTLDVASGTLVEVVGVVEDVFLTEPEWGADGTVLVTRVDREGVDEQLDIVAIQPDDGVERMIAEGAVTAAAAGDVVHYLDVEADSAARRSVRRIDLATGEDVAVATGARDLDHLIVDAAGALAVAAIESEEDPPGLTFGAPAQAHGSHDLPSVWWDVDVRTPYEIEPTTTYDAAMVDGTIATVTLEGLSLLVDGVKLDLIASRALRFVTG